MWSLISVSSVFMRLRSCCACIAACVFFSIIRFFSSSRCRISSTCETGTFLNFQDCRGWFAKGPGREEKSLGESNPEYSTRNTYDASTRDAATQSAAMLKSRVERREERSSTQFSATAWPSSRQWWPLPSTQFAVALTWLPTRKTDLSNSWLKSRADYTLSKVLFRLRKVFPKA